jgi:hypothetical protein
LTRFIISLLGVAAMIAGTVLFAVHKQWITQPTFFYQTLILVLFTTVVIFAYLYKVSKPTFFVQLYLLTMMIKIMAYGTYTYFMITEDVDSAFANVVFFLIAYFIFTVLEIGFLYRKISTSHTSQTAPKNF